MKKLFKVGLVLAIIGTIGTLVMLVGVGVNPRGLFSIGPQFKPNFMQSSMHNGKHNSNDMMRTEDKFDYFDNLEIDLDIGDVTITQGPIFAIYIEECRVCDVKINYEINGDTLELTNKSSRFNKNIMTPKVEVMVPETLKDIDIEVDMGALLIKNISADTLSIDANMNATRIYDSVFNKADISSDVGSIDVKGIFRNLELVNNLGEIKFEGNADYLTVSNDIGNSNITLDGRQNDYIIDAKTDIGSLKVHGHKSSGMGKHYQINKGTNASKEVIINNNLGNVTLNFTQN